MHRPSHGKAHAGWSFIFGRVVDHERTKNTRLMSDGSQIYHYQNTGTKELKDKKWKPVQVKGNVAMLKGVTRLASNNGNTRVAVVVGE